MRNIYGGPLLVSPEARELYSTAIQDGRLNDELVIAMVKMVEQNESLHNLVLLIGKGILERKMMRQASGDRTELKSAFHTGAYAGYMALSLESASSLPTLHQEMVSQSLEGAPPANHTTKHWHFALEADEQLTNLILDIEAHQDITVPSFVSDGLRSGAGLVSLVFNDQLARTN